MELKEMGALAKQASYSLANISAKTKNDALEAIAAALCERADEIICANRIDVDAATENGMSKAMTDRLLLTKERIDDIANGVRKVKDLDDPIGETIRMEKRPNGLEIGQKRVPIGVIAIIYESRPNVTADAAALCLKTSNAVILRGGSEAVNSNKAIVKIMQDAAYGAGIPEGSINLVEDTSRETAAELMRLREYVDVLIPRGGKGLIKAVVENADIPVIETGSGNCHIYIDEKYDKAMALDILINAKTSRPSVCNAAETLLVARSSAAEFIPAAFDALKEKGVEIRGCEECMKIYPGIKAADEEDYYTEYNDYIISVKVVDGIDAAIAHINKYNTKHSEAIVTTDYFNAQKFLNEVDAAAVYVNASTRFTDGFEFGFGAEIGISTQKIHARGPMGLRELTSTKYVIYGNGQIR
ncbi:MAG: glutamate-5-semialdehyde dehydrogenase [Oscillospiraceae bacterium]|nr:glutamate-5-semialdehyde dehydrogenase [Oscillospiraceae bacterium]